MEVCRLRTVELTGLDEIARPERNIERLSRVQVEVFEAQRDCAVGIREPTLEDRNYWLARFPDRRDVQRKVMVMRQLAPGLTEPEVYFLGPQSLQASQN